MSKTQASIDALDIGMRNAIAFTKMQALGNDFILVEERELALNPDGQSLLTDLGQQGARLARNICDRRLGIGADGLIIVRKPQNPECSVAWMYFNSDGSISAMCGNGLRCLGLFSVETKLVTSDEFKVETAVGPSTVKVIDQDIITSDLGVPLLASGQIPLSGEHRDSVLKETLSIDGQTLIATCVNVGNPHCVIFNSGLDEEEMRLLAPKIQQLPLFPEGVNVEFAQVTSSSHANVFVWERGCGATLACASGAAAVLVAGVLEGRLTRAVTIDLPGGSLRVWWSDADDHIHITGPAQTVFRGVFDLSLYWTEDDER